MKKTGPHKNISKVKVQLPGDKPGTAHLFELRADGVHVSFQPGKGNHKNLPAPRHFTFERLNRLRASASVARTDHGTPVEECAAVLADLQFLQAGLARGEYDLEELQAIREQLRSLDKTLGKL